MTDATTHELKTWPIYFRETTKGTKTFEVRRDDRPFAVGDTLLLREWDEGPKVYTGRRYLLRVTYILRESLGLADGFCVLGVEPARP